MRSDIAHIATKRAGFVDLSVELKKRLGQEVSVEARAGGELDEDACIRLVTRNAFKGMAPAQAARKYLLEVGRGVAHPVLVKALLRGNVKSGSKHATDAVRTALHRHKDWFVWKKEKGQRGTWELVEWQTTAEELRVEPAPASATSGSPALSLVGQSNFAAQK